MFDAVVSVAHPNAMWRCSLQQVMVAELLYVQAQRMTRRIQKDDLHTLSKAPIIHKSVYKPSIHFHYLTRGRLDPIPGDSGHKDGDTLDRVPTHSHTLDNSEMPVSLERMRKP